jgi:hypothetical protein
MVLELPNLAPLKNKCREIWGQVKRALSMLENLRELSPLID